MKIKIKGEMSLAELRQCIFEQLHIMEDRFAVRHTSDVTLYLNLTNGFGDAVTCRDSRGHEISTMCAQGPYEPAAITFDIS
jgi:hypothetical protein